MLLLDDRLRLQLKESLALACLFGLPLVAAALENTPVVRVDAAGGQIFFKDSAGTSKTLVGSASGTGDWIFADGLKLSDDDVLLPTFSGQYLRRDQVNQIGGGGTLVSETLDDDASLRWIHSMGSWLIKPNVNYKSELAVSLPQDSLGKGFFDMRQAGAGVELERKGERLKSVRQNLGVSRTDYYHYQAARSPLFGAEFLLDRRALDFVSYDYSIAADYVPWGDGLLSASAEGSYADYAHQQTLEPNPVNPAGFVISSTNRHDWLGTWLLGLTQRWAGSLDGTPVEGSAGLTAGYVVLSSNQNDFDASQSGMGARFNSNYYSYHEISAGPLLSVTSGKWKSSLSYNYAQRSYVSRPVQDSSGAYLGGAVRTDTQTAAYSLTCQLGRGFSAQASGGYVHAASNTRFENFYLYNYSYPYYFLGFGYSL